MKHVDFDSLSEKGKEIVSEFRRADMQMGKAKGEGSQVNATYSDGPVKEHYLSLYRGFYNKAQKDFIALYNGEHELTKGLPKSTIQAYLDIADRKQVADDFAEPAEFKTVSDSSASHSNRK
jgi:hypothetical protein